MPPIDETETIFLYLFTFVAFVFSSDFETNVSDLKQQIERTNIQLLDAQAEINKLKSTILELEASNQLLRDEQCTLQLALNRYVYSVIL